MSDEPRTATLRTDHGTPTHAKWVAAAVAPDNTDSMTTTVDGTAVRTEIERETTGGLQTTVDDYIVNLSVATAVIEAVEEPARDGEGERTAADQPTDNRHQHE